MTLDEWAQILDMIVKGGGLILAYTWWYTLFRGNSKDDNEDFCDKIQNDYPEAYKDLMNDNDQFRKTCCRFPKHRDHPKCGT